MSDKDKGHFVVRSKKSTVPRYRARRIAARAAAKMRNSIAKNSATRLKDVWSNSKAASVGYMAGQGFTSTSTAHILGDGTSPDTIRRMWRSWDLKTESQEDRHMLPVPVLLSAKQRQRLFDMADAENMQPAEFLRKIAVIIIQDKHDLYKAIIDEDDE